MLCVSNPFYFSKVISCLHLKIVLHKDHRLPCRQYRCPLPSVEVGILFTMAILDYGLKAVPCKPCPRHIGRIAVV